MQKNPQNKAGIFWIFMDFDGLMRVQSPTWTPKRKFRQSRH